MPVISLPKEAEIGSVAVPLELSSELCMKTLEGGREGKGRIEID